MKKRFDIQDAIYRSKINSGMKGHRTEIEEMYIWAKQQMIVALMKESSFDSNDSGGSYSYGFYSLMIDHAIPEKSNVYTNLVKQLPDVTQMNSMNTDKKIDYLRKMELEDKMSEFADLYIEQGKVSFEYAAILKELSEMVSVEAAKIYQFFYENMIQQ